VDFAKNFIGQIFGTELNRIEPLKSLIDLPDGPQTDSNKNVLSTQYNTAL
jgi:hypothetical protein